MVDQEGEVLADQEKRRLVLVVLEMSPELGSTVDDMVDLIDWARACKN